MANKYDSLKKWVRVACNGCTACCCGNVPLLTEFGDDPGEYETVEVAKRVVRHGGAQFDFGPGLAIKAQDDGWCPYRNEGVGCDLHNDSKPWFCKIFNGGEYKSLADLCPGEKE